MKKIITAFFILLATATMFASPTYSTQKATANTLMTASASPGIILSTPPLPAAIATANVATKDKSAYQVNTTGWNYAMVNKQVKANKDVSNATGYGYNGTNLSTVAITNTHSAPDIGGIATLNTIVTTSAKGNLTNVKEEPLNLTAIKTTSYTATANITIDPPKVNNLNLTIKLTVTHSNACTAAQYIYS